MTKAIWDDDRGWTGRLLTNSDIVQSLKAVARIRRAAGDAEGARRAKQAARIMSRGRGGGYGHYPWCTCPWCYHPAGIARGSRVRRSSGTSRTSGTSGTQETVPVPVARSKAAG